MVRKLLLGLLLLTPLAFYPFLRAKPVVEQTPLKLTDEHHLALHAVGASTSMTFPAGLPWGAMHKLTETDELEKVAKTDPVKFLEHCIARYEKDVQGYRCNFWKQERVKGTMRPYEKIRVHFREKPFSVHMQWLEGENLCIRSMYVEGENDGNLLARGLLFGVEVPVLLRRPVWASDAKSSSRFPITKFGVNMGQRSTLDSIHRAQKADTLHLKYLGTERVEKTGNRMCYKLIRTPYVPPEEGDDNLNELTIYIDRATLLQVGSVLKNASGEPLAEYFFREIELNPTFDEDQFTEKTL